MVGQGADCDNTPLVPDSDHCNSNDLACAFCPESTNTNTICLEISGELIIINTNLPRERLQNLLSNSINKNNTLRSSAFMFLFFVGASGSTFSFATLVSLLVLTLGKLFA